MTGTNALSKTRNNTKDTAIGYSEVDPRDLFARALTTATPIIDAIRPQQLSLPTPCDAMDVRQLLGHLVMVGQRVAAAGGAQAPATWPGEVAGLGDHEWATAWKAAAEATASAWEEDNILNRDTDLPWATLPGAAVLGIYIAEVTVHTWDLAQALETEPVWDQEVISAALAAIGAQLPMAERGEYWAAAAATVPDEYPWADPFADAIPVAEDASALDRLVAWTGRRP